LLLFSKRSAFFLSMRQPQGNLIFARPRAAIGNEIPCLRRSIAGMASPFEEKQFEGNRVFA